jgi:hypothetical protein
MIAGYTDGLEGSVGADLYTRLIAAGETRAGMVSDVLDDTADMQPKVDSIFTDVDTLIGGGITIERVGYSIPGLKSERMLVIVRRGS